MNRAASLVVVCTLALAACQPPKPRVTGDPMTTPAYIRAVALLQTQARSADPIVRANCIEALQSSPDPRAMQAIEQGLHDEEWVVRFSATMASGKRKAHSVLPVLESMAVGDSSGSVRVASIYALDRMDRAAHMDDLVKYLGARDPSTRANTALVLGTLGNESAIDLLQSHKDEEDIRVKFEITAALARLGDRAAQNVIISWAVHKFAEDQWNAMTVCGDLPPTIAESPLLLGLQPSESPASASQPAGIRDLTTRRQLVAARSLAKLRNGAGSKIAIDNLQNPNPELRSLALLALGEMLTPEQVPGIEPYLEDKDEGVRRAAAAAVINVFTRSTSNHYGPAPASLLPPPH